MTAYNIFPLEVNEILETKKEKYQFVDVREHDEIESQGKIRNFVNVPFGLMQTDPELFKSIFLDYKNKKLVVSCRSGRRSAATSDILINNFGLQNVYNLNGGILSWIENKLDVQTFQKNHSPWVHQIASKTYLATNVDTKESVLISLSTEVTKDEAKIKEFVDLHNITIKYIVYTSTAPKSIGNDFLSKLPFIETKESVNKEWIQGNHLNCKIPNAKAIVVGDSLFGEFNADGVDLPPITRHYT